MDSESWNIPTDLIADIFLRVPAKSIVRCMLTCKRWYSIIKSAQFILIHLNYSKIKDNRILIVKEGSFSIYSESVMTLMEEESGRIPFPVVERDLYILGSCRGLVLVRLRVERGWMVLLWNPLLERFKLIDTIVFDRPHGNACTVLSSWTSYVFALGFNEANNDYRVVRIARKEVEVYGLTRDSWHRVDGTLTDGGLLPAIAFPKKMPTYLNGVVHWLAYYDKDDDYMIMSFDFDNEVFEVIELPYHYGTYVDESYSLELIEINGKLALVGVYFHAYPWKHPTFTWVMMNYPFVDSWSNIDCLFELEGKHELWPVVCTKKGNCVFRPISYAKHDLLMYYNAKEDKIHDLKVVAPYICPVIVDFTECLVLLDVENDVLDDHTPPQ